LSTSVAADDKSGEAARLRRFAETIDALRARVEAEIGAEDVAYIRKVRRCSLALEVAGRSLIHFSVDPITFAVGVAALWVHKQLETAEIGHTTLHGTYDKLPGADDFRSRTFRWRFPVDEQSWREGHNVRHHQYTNIAGRDPDIHFGQVRLNRRTPHQLRHYLQLPMVLVHSSHFGLAINVHVTGVIDALFGNGRPERLDFLPDDRAETKRAAYRRALRKLVPYYARELVFFPAFAGPFFGKVLLGNLLTEVLRDIYTAATVLCGHVGPDVADYPEGTRAGSRGAWYRMQVEAANNFEVPRLVSILCGALDLQIEHHLFPRFPTNRLRQVAAEVRQACADCGVAYHSEPWGRTLAKVGRQLWRLSFPDRPPKALAHSS
jgi:NADPH-dependent stearoyl-CoA 9-desaturase